MRAEAPPPTRNFTAYRACAAENAARPPETWTFKSDPRYTPILEHDTPAWGRGHLARVRKEFPEQWVDVWALLPQWTAEADALGRPARALFPAAGLDCSPANLRYLHHALLLLRHAQRTGVRPLRVVELGGGYGGLAHYTHRLARFFGAPLTGYDLVDVPEAAALQRAYCAALGVGARCHDGLDPSALDALVAAAPGALFFSAYAFSEFDADTRAWYTPLVRACAHGVVVWNFSETIYGHAEKPLGGPLYPFVDAPLTVRPERPLTGPDNLEVFW